MIVVRMLMVPPLCVPLIAPELEIASAVYNSVASEVRALENALIAARSKFAKERRKEQAHVIFKDIQRTSPDRVELMLGAQQTTITEVDGDSLMVSVSPHVQLNADKPCFAGGKERVIVHAEDSDVFLMDVEGLKVGDSLVQTEFTGKVDDLFGLFKAEWSKKDGIDTNMSHRHSGNKSWTSMLGISQDLFVSTLKSPRHNCTWK